MLVSIFSIVLSSSYFVSSKYLNAETYPQVKGQKTEKVNPSVANKANKPSIDHKKNIEEIGEKLKEVSVNEGIRGNVKVSEEINEIIEEQEIIVQEAAEAMEVVENEPKWKVLLFGSDYKNLGVLRSALVHNTNTIRKLTQTMERVNAGDSTEAMQAQLGELTQEKERIESFIQEKETQFSLLGWVRRLLIGSTSVSVENEEVDETTGSSLE